MINYLYLNYLIVVFSEHYLYGFAIYDEFYIIYPQKIYHKYHNIF